MNVSSLLIFTTQKDIYGIVYVAYLLWILLLNWNQQSLDVNLEEIPWSWSQSLLFNIPWIWFQTLTLRPITKVVSKSQTVNCFKQIAGNMLEGVKGKGWI